MSQQVDKEKEIKREIDKLTAVIKPAVDQFQKEFQQYRQSLSTSQMPETHKKEFNKLCDEIASEMLKDEIDIYAFKSIELKFKKIAELNRQ